MQNSNDITKFYEILIGFFVISTLFIVFTTAMLWAAEREQELGIWDKSSERILVEAENK